MEVQAEEANAQEPQELTEESQPLAEQEPTPEAEQVETLEVAKQSEDAKIREDAEVAAKKVQDDNYAAMRRREEKQKTREREQSTQIADLATVIKDVVTELTQSSDSLTLDPDKAKAIQKLAEERVNKILEGQEKSRQTQTAEEQQQQFVSEIFNDLKVADVDVNDKDVKAKLIEAHKKGAVAFQKASNELIIDKRINSSEERLRKEIKDKEDELRKFKEDSGMTDAIDSTPSGVYKNDDDFWLAFSRGESNDYERAKKVRAKKLKS